MIFIRNESFKEYIRYYPITTGIICLNTIVWLVSLVIGTETANQWGGISPNAVIQGEFYRVLTFSFFHGSFTHFLANMTSTVLLGPPLEKLLRWRGFSVLFISSICMAAVFIIFFSVDVHELTVGESGFGYGLLGYYLYILLFQKKLLDKQSQTVLVIMIGLGWVLSFFMNNISILGHFGGFFMGFVLAFLIQGLVRGQRPNIS